MEKQQAEPYAGVAVPVNEMQPAAPVAPVQAVAQETVQVPTLQAFSHPAGSIMHVQLADGRILKVNVPPGPPPGHQIHFPVAAAPPPTMPPPPPVVSQPGVGVASVTAPETVTVNVPPGLGPGSVFRVTLTDGRPLDVTVPHGVPPGAPLTIPVPPRPVDRHGRPLAGIRKKTHPCGDCWVCAAGPLWICLEGGPGGCECDPCCRTLFLVVCCILVFGCIAGAIAGA